MTNSITKHLHRLIFFSVLAVASSASAQAERDYLDLAAATEKGMALWNVPGMAVTVVSKDEVHFQRGFGLTDIVDGEAVDQHTLFAIASTTKAMVVSGILMLVDEGRLSLDDPIIKHIPELHFKAPLITDQIMIRDLLAHRTGLPGTNFWTFLQNMTIEEQVRRMGTVTPEAPIRTRLIYQNTMYELAGLLIERLSGKRWDHYLTERLWQPIGMHETYGSRAQIDPSNTHVTPYQYFDDELTKSRWNFSAEQADAAGSVWSSIHDMGLWAQFLLNDGVTSQDERLISKDQFEEMFKPHQLAAGEDFYPSYKLTKPNWMTYGLGWFQQDFQGRMIQFHTGSLTGLIALIGLDRASDRAVIILGNRDHAEMRHALLWEVMDKRTGEQRPDWNRDIFDLYEKQAAEQEKSWQKTISSQAKNTHTSVNLDSFDGTYNSMQNGEIEIDVVDDKLIFKTARDSIELQHWHNDTFLLEYPPWEIRLFATFEVDTQGKVDSLYVFDDVFIKTENKAVSIAPN